jgi:ABC-type polysaccharide/polyol phosphate transport system ATPase subunit
VRSAVSLRGIGKKYRLSPSRSSRLGEVLSFGRAKRSHDFWALQDVDLEVAPGTTLGILGRNGAGKSTLLRIISGVLQPTTGTVEVEGRLAAIFGLGAGFNPDFTGRDNVMLNGLILGIERDEILERMDEIAAFADIGEFMDQPVRTYSSGMRSRLGFAVAINVEPDVLVVDEALSAGDAAFKKKAIQRMYDLRESGTTVLFVSHSMGMVKRFCTEAVLLHRGRLLASGDPGEVADRYEELISGSREARSAAPDPQLDDMLAHEEEEDVEQRRSRPSAPSKREGTKEARIEAVEVLDGGGTPAGEASPHSTITVRVRLLYERAVEGSVLGVALHNRKAGVEVFSTDTEREGTPLGSREKGERATVDFTFPVPLQPAAYRVGASITVPREEHTHLLDRADTAFRIARPETGGPVRGLVHLPTRVEISGLDGERERPGRSA